MKKITITNPFALVLDFFTRSISRLIMGAFVLVLLLPIGFLIPSLVNNNIWESVHQDNLKKHLLLATSLVEPVSLHFKSHQQSLQSLGSLVGPLNSDDRKKIQGTLDNFVNSNPDIVATTFVSVADNSVITRINDTVKRTSKISSKEQSLHYILSEEKYSRYDITNSISSVFKSSISNQPAILIKHYVLDEKLNKRGTLFAEIGLGFIHKICGQIKFGKQGHCLITDAKAHIVDHPDPLWVNQIKDISNDSIVKKAIKGESGTSSYYPAFSKEEMLAGFTSIEDLGWGIIILQPKKEIDVPIKSIMSVILSWAIAGAIIALLLAFFLTRQITKPLNILVTKSREIDVRSDSFRLEAPPKRCPVEISLLWNTLSKLVLNFQESTMEVKKLNYSLNNDIRKVAAKLRDKKQYLHEMNNRDTLTEIANRDCFKKELAKVLRLNRGDKIGIILLDIDEFKNLNAANGHDAGDIALKHVAKILHANTRSGDMAARYGGDEFIVFIKNCSEKSLYATAEKLRSVAEKSPILWDKTSIIITLSIGIVLHEIKQGTSLDLLLKIADEALYEAKKAGQNHVFSHKAHPEELCLEPV